MDSSKNIHSIMGFKAGTHLNGSITVPSTYTTSYQYYLVKFNYDNGNMTPGTPLLLPITGDGINAGGAEGKANLVYDENLNRYYLAGKKMYSGYGYMEIFLIIIYLSQKKHIYWLLTAVMEQNYGEKNSITATLVLMMKFIRL